jgi:hypothetical protein
LDEFRGASELFGSCPIKTGAVWALTTGANILFCLGFLKKIRTLDLYSQFFMLLDALQHESSTSFNQNFGDKRDE